MILNRRIRGKRKAHRLRRDRFFLVKRRNRGLTPANLDNLIAQAEARQASAEYTLTTIRSQEARLCRLLYLFNTD